MILPVFITVKEEEMKKSSPSPSSEEISDAVEMYPAVPNPSTVLANPEIVERYPSSPKPSNEETRSIG